MRHLFPLLLLLATLAGCESETCEGACHQYYGADACNQMPNGNRTQDQAENDCVQDCSEALYATGDTVANGGRVYRGGNEHDALAFIRCVTDQDYSDLAMDSTCINQLKIPCGFSW